MAIGGGDAPAVQDAPVHPMTRPVTLGWFLKRSLAGIVILLVAMGGLAWLTYASIDQDLDAEASPKSTKAAQKVPVRLHL